MNVIEKKHPIFEYFLHVYTDDRKLRHKSLPIFSRIYHRVQKWIVTDMNHVFMFQDSDLKQYWMPDSQCKECYDCNEKFTTFRRRHHCRLCGQIFCSRCCNQEIPGKFMGYTGECCCGVHCGERGSNSDRWFVGLFEEAFDKKMSNYFRLKSKTTPSMLRVFAVVWHFCVLI